MFDIILYPTDFSDVSKKALEYVKRLKETGTGKVIILHVVEPVSELVKAEVCEPGSSELEDLPTVDFLPELCEPECLVERCKSQLTAVEKEMREAGLMVRSEICEGSPSRQILRVEAEEGVSLIVMGAHNRSNVEKVILGSVTEKVISRCKSPVLVIKE